MFSHFSWFSFFKFLAKILPDSYRHFQALNKSFENISGFLRILQNFIQDFFSVFRFYSQGSSWDFPGVLPQIFRSLPKEISVDFLQDLSRISLKCCRRIPPRVVSRCFLVVVHRIYCSDPLEIIFSQIFPVLFLRFWELPKFQCLAFFCSKCLLG